MVGYQPPKSLTLKASGGISLMFLSKIGINLIYRASDAGSSKYQLKASTGHGAFAQVYLAEALNKTGDSRRVVLKVR